MRENIVLDLRRVEVEEVQRDLLVPEPREAQAQLLRGDRPGAEVLGGRRARYLVDGAHHPAFPRVLSSHFAAVIEPANLRFF